MNFFYRLRAKRFYQDQKISELNFFDNDDLDVTFAIPNNNGMNRGLPKLLDSIYSQAGISVKVVVVDSGSTDASVEYCQSKGCEVIEIEAENFSHSYSRNQALERVTTPYVIFTVNDAYFDDKYYAVKAICLIRKFDLAAVSGMQYTPHEDIYSLFLERSLSKRFPPIGYIRTTKDYISISSKLLPSYIAGSLYGLDNVNATYDARILKSIRFRNETVEDMSIAKSIIHSGYKIGITLNLSVIHGHLYNDLHNYYKRVLSDLKIIKKLFYVRVLPVHNTELFSALTMFYIGFLDWQEKKYNSYSPIKLFFYINLFAFKKKYKVSVKEIKFYESKSNLSSSYPDNNLKIKSLSIFYTSLAICRQLQFINKDENLNKLLNENRPIMLDQIVNNLLARLLASSVALKIN